MTKQATEQSTAPHPPRRTGRIIGRILAVVGVILIIGVAAFVVWATWVPNPMPEALAALESDAAVTVSGQNPIVFTPAASAPACGFIFYAGGRVDERAYAPALRAVAEEGILALLPSMPLNLAVFSPNRAAGLMAQYPDIERWVIGGHSLGGAMAAAYADSHPAGQPGGVHGLSLWAAYPAGGNDLSARTDLAISSIYASNDGLALISDIDESRARLPQSTTFTRIEGGNHAGFGWYGPQGGDGEATITRAEQQQQTVAATLATIRSACGQR